MTEDDWFVESLRRDAKIPYYVFVFHCSYYQPEKVKYKFLTGKIGKTTWSKHLTFEYVTIVATHEDIARAELKRLYYPDSSKWLKEESFTIINMTTMPIKSLLIEH